MRSLLVTLCCCFALFSEAQITCSVSLQQNSPCAPKPILANATASSVSPITQYCWRLTNCATGAVIFQSCGSNPSFAYVDTVVGNLCLRMTVFNAAGDSCVQTVNNILVSGSPTINMGISNTEGCCGLNVQMQCNITPGCGAIDSLVIQPGCGPIIFLNSCPSGIINIPYSCSCPPGLYDITVVAKNSCGCYAPPKTYLDTVRIIPKPVAFFTADTTEAHCASGPLAVNFTANNAGPNMTYKWYVDGALQQSSTAPAGLNFAHSFPISANCYDVKLVVVHASGGGCIDSITLNDFICNTSTPVINISSTVSTTCVNATNPATITLTDNTGGGPHTITWAMPAPLGTQTSSPATYTTTASGTYTVTVTASYGGNCSATLTQLVTTLQDKPISNFTIVDDSLCKLPASVSANATPCTGCTYGWNFAGSASSPGNTPTPTVAYTTTGTFQVSLVTTSPNGCATTFVKNNAVVIKKLGAKIGMNGAYGCPPKCVTFTNLTPAFPGETVVPSNVCWSFPGSGIAGQCNNTINQCFVTPGCYDVQLAVTSNSGCTDTVKLIDTVCVHGPPVCSVTATPDSMCYEADSVAFTIMCDSANLVHAIYGDTGEDWGYPTPGTPFTLIHTYLDFGTFNSMIITYRDSCLGDTFIIPITIFPPAAKFKDSSSCNLGDSIILVNEAKYANRWTWSLCNGDTIGSATGPKSPKVKVPLCDTCTVSLTAYNDTTGCIHQYVETINTPCNTVTLSPSDTTYCGGFITITNTSPDQVPSQTQWDLQGTQAISWSPIKGPTYQYNLQNPGYYDFAMLNTTSGGCKDTAFTTIHVCKITANFGPTNVCLPDSFYFVDLSKDSTCGITHWQWSFGDGSPQDTTQNPVHGYANSGTYQVQLVVSNASGCQASVTKSVVVGGYVNFDYQVDTTVCPGPGHNVCVVNNTQSPGVTLNWQWTAQTPGGTIVSTQASPCFGPYTVPGDYRVTMIMQSATCTRYDTFFVHAQFPIAAGYVDIDTVDCPNPPVIITFTDTSLYKDGPANWDFGGQGVANFDVATFFFSAPGSYVITNTVSTLDGCVNTAIIDTIVVLGPYGNATYSPPGICSCKENVDYVINSVYADTVTLLFGCNTGFIATPINVPGTPANPLVTNLSIPYCITDTCQPQLIFADASGCRVFQDLPYLPVDSPVIKYFFDNYGVCVQGTVCFRDSTKYTLGPNFSWTTQRLWDFGDALATPANPNTDTAANPCHYFSQPGGYTVKLYIWSNLGCMDSLVSNIVVIPEFPIADYTQDDTLVCAYSPACFHDSSWIYPLTGADYWVWCWGDGSCDTIHGNPDACHIYTTGGSYNITMWVVDSVGCGDSVGYRHITVVDNPIADAGGDQIACYGTVTQLNGSGSTTCQWSPPGLVSNPNICNPTITLTQDDSLTLIVTDQYGCADTAMVHFTVARVFADFNVGTTFCSDDSVCVTDNSTNVNGVINVWRYDYGDNSPFLFGPNVCHNYFAAGPGTYNIELLVSDTTGCVDSITKPVTILPSPVANFSLNDTIICSDQAICITDLTTSAAPINSWQWYYGDFPNTPVNGANPPCHQYAAPLQNNYTVSLIVTDQNNCADTASIIVTVNEVPTADFNWTTSCETQPMPLTSVSTPGDGAINFCEWTLWQGAPSPVIDNNCNTSFQFPPGQFPVQFIVRDVNGCADTIVKTVFVDSVSQLVIYPGDTTICAGTSVDYTVGGVFDQIVWTPNVWLSDPNSTTVTVNPLSNISYIINAVNGVCAAASDTFSIRVIQPIPIEVFATPEQIVLGLTSNLTSQIPGDIDSIIWTPEETLDCRDCPNPIALPIATTTYTATIYYSENGVTCTNSASVTITVLNNCDDKIVYVPNTFTPNNDGINDMFMIRGLAATKINYFRIFDRWGHLVFETQNGAPNEPKWGWDGTDVDGKKLNNAVFVYTYEIECINGDVVHGQGNVTLVR